MAQSFRIETLDRSGRWYLTPGARSIYDLRIRNDSKNAVDCSLVVEDPAAGVSVEPNAFALRGHEVRTITVTFAPEATSGRSHRVLLSLHADDDGRLLATFEHPLVATGGTDCSVAMALKGAIVEAGELRGFEMTCSVRSQSEARSTFQVSLSPHPSFAIPELPALSLEPGQVGEVVIPIRWDRAVKDNKGWNHPAIFELAVPVSNGRRTSRMRWELIEGKLEPFMKTGAAGDNSAVVAPQVAVKTEPAASAPVPPPRPDAAPAAKPQPVAAPVATPQPIAAPVAKPQPVATPAAKPQPDATPAAKPQPVAAPAAKPQPDAAPVAKPQPDAAPVAKPQPDAAPVAKPQPVAAPVAKPQPVAAPAAKPQPVAAPAANKQPEPKPAVAEPVKTASVTPMPAAPKQTPAAAAAPATVVKTASTAAAQSAPSKVAATPVAPLMLNGYVERLMLAAPVEAKPAPAPAVNGVTATDRVEVVVEALKKTDRVEAVKKVEVAKPSTNVAAAAAPQSEVMELSLFPLDDAPEPPVTSGPANGKHEDVAQKPSSAAVQKATPQPQATPAPQASAPEQSSVPTPEKVAPPVPPQPVAKAAPKPSAPAQSAPAKPVPAPAPAATQPAAAQAKPSEKPQKIEAKTVPEAVTPAAPAATATSSPTVQPASAPQWKIVSAAESIAAAAAQASAAPVAQAPVPAAPAAPSPSVATPTTATNASAQTAPQPAPAGPPPKLTPYAAAKWDGADKVAVPVQAARPTPAPAKASAAVEKPADPTPAQATAQTSGSSRVVRERQPIEAPAQRRLRPGLLIGGLAAVAIVAGIIIFKPSPHAQAPSTPPVAVAPPVVAVNPTVQPAVVRAHAAVKPKLMVKPTPNVAATSAPATTPKPATPNPATAAPVTPKPAAQKPLAVATRPRPAPKHVARYGKLYQPESGSVVALGGIEAYYGPRGRAVRVIWSAAEQASASVALINDRGTTVNSVSVRGGRQSVILYVPRGYHGGLTVQVSSIGRLGERVAQTTSLPPFGN